MKFETFSKKSDIDMGDDPEGFNKAEDDIITPDDGWGSLENWSSEDDDLGIEVDLDKAREAMESLNEQRDEQLGEAAIDSLSKLSDEDDWEAMLAEILS